MEPSNPPPSTPVPKPINHLANVILVGLGFMFIFGAFQTCCMVEATVLNAARKQDPNFDGNGSVQMM